jgi:hypothetical protein
MDSAVHLKAAAIDNCTPRTLLKYLQRLEADQLLILDKSPDIIQLRFAQGQRNVTRDLIDLLTKVIH